MRHDPRHLRPLEGSGPWLHKPRPDPRVKDAQKALRRWYVVIAVAVCFLVGLHVLPDAYQNYLHDAATYSGESQ